MSSSSREPSTARRIVFEAWTKPELIKRWWAPKSTGTSLLSCEADVRVGGRYRFVFGLDASKAMAFTGRYIEVTPHARLVWTLLVVHEVHPSKEALDGAIASGMEAGTRETFEQLDELVVTLAASAGRS